MIKTSNKYIKRDSKFKIFMILWRLKYFTKLFSFTIICLIM